MDSIRRDECVRGTTCCLTKVRGLTRSETEVAISSMMISSSVVPGSMVDAKYSVMFGEQHLASTDTSCKALQHQNASHVCILTVCSVAAGGQQQACLVYVFNVILTAYQRGH